MKATFEDGVLRPEEPLALQPGESVRLVVIRKGNRSRWDLDRLAQAAEDEQLAEAGLAEWGRALDAMDGSAMPAAGRAAVRPAGEC